MGSVLEEAKAQNRALIRPKITGATIIYHRAHNEDGRSGLYIEAEEADKLYTGLDTGVIKGNTVFPVRAIVRVDNKQQANKLIFVNMINVEDVIFHTEDEEDDE